MNIQIKNPTYLPQPIRNLINKSLYFNITLNSKNITNKSNIFLISQIYSKNKILQIESNSNPITHIINNSSITSNKKIKN